MQICPECESDLDIEEDDLEEGDVIECPECGSEFEIVSTGPLEMTKVDGEDEDDEDDDGKHDEEEEE